MAAHKKEEKDKYQKYIRVKLLEIEHDKLKEIVSSSGNTISEVIRELIMTGVIVTRFLESDLLIIKSLTGIARNLNQITHQIHLGNNLRIESDLNALIQFMIELKNNYVKGYHDRKS
jgi:hypothetical protein